jgi:uncharacterized membrane protein
MTDPGLSLFLFLHVGAAIIAFGPTFAFPLIGAMGGKEPAHVNFALRINEMLTDRLVIPFALSMPVTGVFLIYFSHVNLADRSSWWLTIAIVLYIIAVSIAIFVQRPVVQHMVELTSKAPPPPAPGAPPPSGPPPAIREQAAKIRRNGSILGLLIVLIVILMVSKPQF